MTFSLSCHTAVYVDRLVQLSKSLGGEGEKVWDEVLGRYCRAVQHLVLDVLKETEYPVEKVVFALTELRAAGAAHRAVQTIQKGMPQCNMYTMPIYERVQDTSEAVLYTTEVCNLRII